jgi:hypothetical protein
VTRRSDDEPPRRLTLAELGATTFVAVEPGACYRLEVPGALVSFELDRLAWKDHQLTGEVLVRCDLAGTEGVDGVLTVTRFNVSSSVTRGGFAKELAAKSRAAEIPWPQLVEMLCQRVLAAERTGDPATALRDIPTAAEIDPLIRVFGFQLPRRHPSIVFGDGGSTKSLLALHIGGLLARDGYRVLLADWELDGADHRERYEALFSAEMPATLFYKRCARPLVHEVDQLRRIVRLQGIDFAIFDSVGFACHEPPETAAAALGYFQAVRQLGIGGLHIAHISKSEHGDQRPFGSAFWHNSARATWFLKPTDDAGGKTVGVFNRKHNVARFLQPPFAYEVTSDEPRTTFRLIEIADVHELAPQVPLGQRIRRLLKGGARTREQIAAEFPDDKPETIRRTVNRYLEKGQLVQFPSAGGEERIGLSARAAS